MGLDMYLTRETYIKNWDHQKPEEHVEVSITRGGKPISLVTPKVIVEEVGYWRKANAIHAWFVRNAQMGIDECQKAPVSKEQLELLFKATKTVLNDHNLAPRLLPTESGFFFGSTDLDEYYFEDLERTITIIGGVIETTDFARSEIYYQSSW